MLHLGDPFEGQSPLQRILPSVLFDVGLPTLDVYSDLSLIIPWLIGHHYIYGTSMAIPLLLSFIAIAYKWYKLEKPQDKRWSWVFLLLQCWPQLRALRVIRKVYRGDPKAYEEKTKFNTELGSIEPFLESIPSLMIMTAIWAHATQSGAKEDFDCNIKEGSSFCVVFGGIYDSFSFWWFWITYSISVFAAALGITKLLMNGPCPILTEDGRLGGILTYSFFTHFLAVLFSLGSLGTFVGLCIGFVARNDGICQQYKGFNIPIRGYWLPWLPSYDGQQYVHENCNGGNVVWMSVMCFVLTLAPNFIFSFINIAVATGCNQKFFRTILGYPAIWLLPAVTFFVVGPENKALRENLGCNKRKTCLDRKSNI